MSKIMLKDKSTWKRIKLSNTPAIKDHPYVQASRGNAHSIIDETDTTYTLEIENYHGLGGQSYIDRLVVDKKHIDNNYIEDWYKQKYSTLHDFNR